MNNTRIAASAKYLPENIVTNEDISKLVDTNDEWISSRTGIKERRISKSENTSDLATGVAVQLLEKAGVSAGDIGVIVIATVSPDFICPSVGCIVQKNIGAVNAMAFDISAACTGFIYAMSVGDKMVRAGYDNVLVIGTEVLSKFVNWNDRSICVLLGDGAGGVLLKKGEKPLILAEDIHADGNRADVLKFARFDVANAFADKKQSNNLTDEDFFIKMNGREVFDFVSRTIPENIKIVLKKSGVSLDELSYIVPHQANIRLIEVMAKKLRLPMSKFYVNIDIYGNTSSASIPIALAEMAEKGLVEFNSGQKILFVGFGGGLTWGSMVLSV